jgi:hypothetical protein
VHNHGIMHLSPCIFCQNPKLFTIKSILVSLVWFNKNPFSLFSYFNKTRYKYIWNILEEHVLIKHDLENVDLASFLSVYSFLSFISSFLLQIFFLYMQIDETQITAGQLFPSSSFLINQSNTTIPAI